MRFTMKTFIILASLYGLVAAGEKNCGLTIKADKDYQCSEFVKVATEKPGRYEVEGLTVELLNQLNPRLNCSGKIPSEIAVCVRGPGKFDDVVVQAGATLENFGKAMGVLKRTRSNKFNPRLYDAIISVVKEEKTLRRKRSPNAPLTDKEKAMVEEFSNIASIEAIEATIAKDENFKALEAEFNRDRYTICAQLKEEEQGKPKGEYRMCVCARGKEKYPKGPPPFLHCQAVLMKEQMEKKVKMEYNPNEALVYPAAKRSSFARKSSEKMSFGQLMTKIGCPTIDCLTKLCFGIEYSCTPLPPPASFLSTCVSGELCMPQLGSVVQISAFEDSKISAKVGICITGFNEVLSWIGLEACLAAIQLEYYFFKSQLDASVIVSLVVIKLTGGIKAQVAPSFSTGMIPGAGWMKGSQKVDDICTLNDHKCQHYCAAKPGELAAYGKVEYWWWWWREAVNVETKPNKPGC